MLDLLRAANPSPHSVSWRSGENAVAVHPLSLERAELSNLHPQIIVSAFYFASFQFCPTPISTRNGTFSG